MFWLWIESSIYSHQWHFLLSFTKVIASFARWISYNRNVTGNSIWVKIVLIFKSFCLDNLFSYMNSVQMIEVRIINKSSLWNIIQVWGLWDLWKIHILNKGFIILEINSNIQRHNSHNCTCIENCYLSEITSNYK